MCVNAYAEQNRTEQNTQRRHATLDETLPGAGSQLTRSGSPRPVSLGRICLTGSLHTHTHTFSTPSGHGVTHASSIPHAGATPRILDTVCCMRSPHPTPATAA